MGAGGRGGGGNGRGVGRGGTSFFLRRDSVRVVRSANVPKTVMLLSYILLTSVINYAQMKYCHTAKILPDLLLKRILN